MATCLLLLLPTTVFAHGGMIFPHIWQDSGRVPLDKMRLPLTSLETSVSRTGGPAMISKPWEWFTNNTHIPKKPVIASWMLASPRTRNDHPWQAPGTAPVFSPCGVNGGNPKGCLAGRDLRPKGSRCPLDFDNGAWTYGRKQEEYQFPNATTTRWRQGSVQEVAWLSGGKHAGGYSYRLCSLGKSGKRALTEKCFQRLPLKFFSNKTWIRTLHRSGKVSRWRAVKAHRTSLKTFPPGSQWTKVAEPNKGMRTSSSNLSKVRRDKVLVPRGLKPGRYVLSFRWDCEHTPQVWSGCANILITS